MQYQNILIAAYDTLRSSTDGCFQVLVILRVSAHTNDLFDLDQSRFSK